MNCIELNYPLIHHPGCLSITGPSFSGKTTILKKLIKYRDEVFTAKFQHIIYCYAESSSGMEDDFPEVEIFKGFPDLEQLQIWMDMYSSQPWLICLDDLSKEFNSNPLGGELATKLSHHNNVTLCVINHSLFSGGSKTPFSRLINLNMHNYIFTRTLRDLNVFNVFGRQCLGTGYGKAFVSAFLDATEGRGDEDNPSYLFVSLHPIFSRRDCMLFSNILPGEGVMIAYRK